jgi:hypothetical protein
MAERLAFLLGKDPSTSHGGDMTMFRAMRAIASERFLTEVICLSDDPERVEPDMIRLPKPAVSLPRLAGSALIRRRSLVHTRFDVDSVRDAVESLAAGRYVAVHSYMAEPYLRATGARPGQDLLVSTEVPESTVWRQTHGPLGWLEGRRLRRDEVRVASAARAVGGYDRVEMDAWRAAGIDARWLPMTLPPSSPVDVAGTPPRLVLLGNRTWQPNAAAAESMLRLWPRIAAGVAGAELVIVGSSPSRATARDLPAGVTDLGFVDHVDDVLAGCRAMAAPVAVGGGVRVKLLEAAARGLAVVATAPAVGSIEASVGITPASDEDDFVARCRAYLLDPELAARAGAELHAVNARRWSDRVGQDAVLGWLAA